ncbi:MAG TPA: hypothetical protein DEP05_00335 [Betaproteobacteria bacterium]|nr:hypothetical protein [Betaproteobacteria bacterium]
MAKSEANKILALYRTALTLSEEMRSLARDSEWDALTAKETARRNVIEELRLIDTAAHTATEFIDAKRSLIQAIMVCDRETQELTRRWSAELKEILDVMNAKKNFRKPMTPIVKFQAG